MKAAALSPQLKAADLFPAAARSNKSLFYQKGEAVGVRELYHKLVRRHQAVSKVAEVNMADVPLPVRKVTDVSVAGTARMEADKRPSLTALTAIEQSWFAQRNLAGGASSLALNDDLSVSSKDGRIGIWGGSPSAHDDGAGVREKMALHRGEGKLRPTPLMEDLGSSQLALRGLFSKGGLGKKS